MATRYAILLLLLHFAWSLPARHQTRNMEKFARSPPMEAERKRSEQLNEEDRLFHQSLSSHLDKKLSDCHKEPCRRSIGPNTIEDDQTYDIKLIRIIHNQAKHLAPSGRTSVFDSIGGAMVPTKREFGVPDKRDLKHTRLSDSHPYGDDFLFPPDFHAKRGPLDSIGGGLVPAKRAPLDSIGGGLVPGKRAAPLDSIGGGLVPGKRSGAPRRKYGFPKRAPLDSIGGFQVPVKKRDQGKRAAPLDSIGGGLVPEKRSGAPRRKYADRKHDSNEAFRGFIYMYDRHPSRRLVLS